MKRRELFLKWLLLQALVVAVAVPAALSYRGGMHVAAIVTVAVVLSVYVAASAYCGLLAWRDEFDRRQHVALAITVTPMLSMLGTASGFLIAFTGDIADVQQRVAGASTGIISTVVGVACTVALIVQRHVLHEG